MSGCFTFITVVVNRGYPYKLFVPRTVLLSTPGSTTSVCVLLNRGVI